MGRKGLMRRMGLLAGMLLMAAPSIAQPAKQMELHGLRAGMLTREIILYAHAPLDTILWTGARESNIIGFKGEFLKDSGEFRVSVNGSEITQVMFLSPRRDSARTRVAFERMHVGLEKLYGQPEKYHNIYRIFTWEAPGQQLKLTTMDGGLFYSLALTAMQPLSHPVPDQLQPRVLQPIEILPEQKP